MRYCHDCGRPRAFKIRGHYRSNKDHTLCRQCWRSLYDSVLARSRPTASRLGVLLSMKRAA
jgi:hypothetical protein